MQWRGGGGVCGVSWVVVGRCEITGADTTGLQSQNMG
jgi:hypothetical protein